MKALRTAIRALLSLSLFCAFGIGGILFSPVVLAAGGKERATALIRMLWRPFLRCMALFRLIDVKLEGYSPGGGRIFVANHPSLIDVVVFVALVPRTMFVAKHALRLNPFAAAFVRSASLPDDERLPDEACGYLAKGWNVLVFPEGTRSPAYGGVWRFRRGAAHLAIKSNAPVFPVSIILSPFSILGKHQYAWQMGERTVNYRLVFGESLDSCVRPGESVRSAAKRITAAAEERVKSKLPVH